MQAAGPAGEPGNALGLALVPQSPAKQRNLDGFISWLDSLTGCKAVSQQTMLISSTGTWYSRSFTPTHCCPQLLQEHLRGWSKCLL